MADLTPVGSKYIPLAMIHDELGWDCFLEGRISVALLDAVGLSLPSRKSITKWGVSFIKTLLSATHQQWLFRNANVHHRFDGLTMHGHNILSLQIRELLTTSPGDLLPAHRYLLLQDFVKLGDADTIQRQIWVASMDSALGAASHFHSGHLTPGSLHKFFQPVDSAPSHSNVRHRFSAPNVNSSIAHFALASSICQHLFGHHSPKGTTEITMTSHDNMILVGPMF